MQKGAVARLITCFLVIIIALFYNINGFLKTNKNIIPSADEIIINTHVSDEIKLDENMGFETSSGVTTKSEETTVSEGENLQSTSSVEVSAQAVKGKIISRYISPYQGTDSFEKVYLKNSAKVSVDIKNLLFSPLSFTVEENDEPQVLIMHTHTTESYMEKDADFYTEDHVSRNADNSKNMVRIGDIIAEKLNSAGVKTLHDTTQHDNPKYTGSYSRAAKTINGYLQKYPSIKIVLDLHRDSVSSGESDKVKLVTEINGKKAAQVMLVMGSESGSITGFPNWQENLKLALKLQQKTEEIAPTLARPILLMSKKYNQNLTKGSLLLEFGTDANTLDEACYSAEIMGDILAQLLKEI